MSRASASPSDNRNRQLGKSHFSTLGGATRATLRGGTGVEVMFIVWMHRAHGLTPEALADEFNITLEQVQAALDYYAHHRKEIDQLIEQHQAENQGTQPSFPTDPLVVALKELSRTQPDVAGALMQLLRSGKRKEVELILQAMERGQAA